MKESKKQKRKHKKPDPKEEIKEEGIPSMSEFEFDDVVSILLGVKSETKIFQKIRGLNNFIYCQLFLIIPYLYCSCKQVHQQCCYSG